MFQSGTSSEVLFILFLGGKIMPSTFVIVISIIAVFFLAALFISEAMHGNLNIKARTVGDGQYTEGS